MQETQNEGDERAGSPADTGAGGVDQGPHQVTCEYIELCGDGWQNRIGYARDYSVASERTIPNEDVHYDLVVLPELWLEQAPALLIAQGRAIQDFFPPDVYFRLEQSKYIISRGPYFFLKGTLTKPHDPPLRLKGVTLAHVRSAPPEMKMEKLRGLLLEQVL